MCTSLFLNPLIPLKTCANSWFSLLGISTLSTGGRKLSTGSCTRLDNSQTNQQQLNLSVLTSPCHSRVLLTLVDGVCVWLASALESFRWLRFSQHDTSATYTIDFGSFFGRILDCTSLSRKISQGATPVDQATALERAEQIFVMSQNDKDNMKENLAWGTYVLLRNTNTIPVLISVQDALYVRGYCNIPRDVSKVDALDWFHTQIQRIGLSDLKETLYFPQSADSEFWEILPEGSRSRLVQTVQQAPAGSANQVEKTEGFVIFVSSIDYAIVIKTELG